MIKHICNNCNKSFAQKGHLEDHLKRKRPCKKDITLEELIEKKVKEVISNHLKNEPIQVVDIPGTSNTMDYSKMCVKELVALCKDNGIKGYPGKKKVDLVDILSKSDVPPVFTPKVEGKTDLIETVNTIKHYKLPLSLYGLHTSNCCGKNLLSEKVVNALLPITVGIYSEKTAYYIPLCDNTAIRPIGLCFPERMTYDTEKPLIHPNFINPPPHDVCTMIDSETYYYESKVVLFKDSKTELILRQDCYAFNCLQHILTNNPSKKYVSVSDLLGDASIVERPYLWMLLWKKTEHGIYFDCVVFTDVSVLRMIKDANTPRAKEALKLSDRSLLEFTTTGKMTYKEEKSKTVAHQKVSLFPLRDIDAIKRHTFVFGIKSTDIVLNNIRPDTSLWQEIEKNKLIDIINAHEKEIERLKKKCGE